MFSDAMLGGSVFCILINTVFTGRIPVTHLNLTLQYYQCGKGIVLSSSGIDESLF